MTKSGRIPCEVLGCRRTADASKHEPGTRICCGKCWRLGSVEARKVYVIAKRQVARLKAAGAENDQINGWRWSVHYAFNQVVQEANEARAGIG